MQSGCGCGAEYYEARAAELGQDPLREDADPEALWAAVHKSRKSIGLCLMSQELIAGVGNIYRAEILFKVSCGQLRAAQPSSQALQQPSPFQPQSRTLSGGVCLDS